MPESKLNHFDIIIAGGGMVGATVAIALAKINASQTKQLAPLKIALV